MTYIDDEKRTAESQPVELFYFKRLISGQKWTYCSAEESITHNASTYVPAAIGRKEIANTKEIAKSGLNIDIDIDTEFMQMMFSEPLFDEVEVTVYRQQFDTGAWGEIFTGYLTSHTVNGYTAELRVDSRILALTRLMNPRLYSSMCPYSLYGERCGVSKLSYVDTGTVSDLNGNVVSATIFGSKVDDWYVGGYIKIGFRYRMVTAHDQSLSQVTVHPPFYGVEVGDTLQAFAGCDHTLGVCHSKFDNALNCGAFAFIPSISPFGQKGLS